VDCRCGFAIVYVTDLDSVHRTARAGRGRSLSRIGRDAYDSALAEATIGLFKTELIKAQGPWRSLDQVEAATLEWVHWSQAIDDRSPVAAEQLRHRFRATLDKAG